MLNTIFQRFLGWIRYFFDGLLYIIFPPIGPERFLQLGRVLWMVLHAVVVVGILVGLYFLNTHWLHLNRWIPRHPFLANAWLSILAALVYAMGWLTWWLWKLLIAEELEATYPDIEEAWNKAVATLLHAGIDVRELPLYLVLGQSSDGDEALFDAAGLKLKFRNVPRGDAPIHVHVSNDAIYVTAPRASALSAQAAWLNSDSGQDGDRYEPPNTDDDKTNLGTNDPGESDGTVAGIRDIVVLTKSEGRAFNAVERREIRRLHRHGGAAGARRNLRDIEDQASRLRFLCRLISRDRRPYCGANGILTLVPFAGTDASQDATDTGDACQRDLVAVRKALGLHCPVIAAVCDMESAPGFTEFVSKFSDRERKKRMGQRCPFIPNLAGVREERQGSPADSMRNVLRGMAHWLCKGFLREWIFRKCELEKSSGDGATLSLETNARLFELLCEMQARKDNLAIILERGFSQYAPVDRLLFGGCYVAATGRRESVPRYEEGEDGPRPSSATQAFLPGVLERLGAGQSCVYWTDELKAEEARLIGWINLGWTVLGLIVLGSVGGVGYYFLFQNR